jgi:hypothetical protein
MLTPSHLRLSELKTYFKQDSLRKKQEHNTRFRQGKTFALADSGGSMEGQKRQVSRLRQTLWSVMQVIQIKMDLFILYE